MTSLPKPASLNDIRSALTRWLELPGRHDGLSQPQTDKALVLAELFDELGDPDLVNSLARTFLDELPARVDRIRNSRSDDLGDGERSAHTLKSTSALVGATALSATAERIERQFRAGELPSDDDLAALSEQATATATDIADVMAQLEGAR